MDWFKTFKGKSTGNHVSWTPNMWLPVDFASNSLTGSKLRSRGAGSHWLLGPATIGRRKCFCLETINQSLLMNHGIIVNHGQSSFSPLKWPVWVQFPFFRHARICRWAASKPFCWPVEPPIIVNRSGVQNHLNLLSDLMNFRGNHIARKICHWKFLKKHVCLLVVFRVSTSNCLTNSTLTKVVSGFSSTLGPPFLGMLHNSHLQNLTWRAERPSLSFASS